MGMMDSSYWMSWHIYHLAISFVSSLLLCTLLPCRADFSLLIAFLPSTFCIEHPPHATIVIMWGVGYGECFLGERGQSVCVCGGLWSRVNVYEGSESHFRNRT